jgi:hypothetical protein
MAHLRASGAILTDESSEDARSAEVFRSTWAIYGELLEAKITGIVDTSYAGTGCIAIGGAPIAPDGTGANYGSPRTC